MNRRNFLKNVVGGILGVAATKVGVDVLGDDGETLADLGVEEISVPNDSQFYGTAADLDLSAPMRGSYDFTLEEFVEYCNRKQRYSDLFNGKPHF